ncbi:DUF6061 family protein [Ruthenibacterium lactatiformans]
MYNLISCEYNTDNSCMESWFPKGRCIDCTIVANFYADNRHQHS